MESHIDFIPGVREDLLELHPNQVQQVFAWIIQLAEDPEGYGENIGSSNGIEIPELYRTMCAFCNIVYWYDETDGVTILEIVDCEQGSPSKYMSPAQRIEHFRNKTKGELERVRVLLNN